MDFQFRTGAKRHPSLRSIAPICLPIFLAFAVVACGTATKRQSEPFYKQICLPERGKGLHLPLLTNVTPSEGNQPGGTPVMLKGEGFLEGAVVFLGKSACTGISVVDPETITCFSAPYGGVRLGQPIDVVVMNPDHRCGILEKSYVYIPTVTIRPRSETVAIGNSIAFTAVDGKKPYTYSIVRGGGTIDPVSGDYKAPGETGNTIVRVTDATGTQSEALVAINPSVAIVPPRIGVAAENQFHISTSGGVPPVTFSMKSGEGSVDPGTGVYSAPSAVGEAIVQVDDSLGNHAEAPIKIYPKLVLSVHGNAASVHQRVTAEGGLPPYQFSIVTGQGSIEPGGAAYLAPDLPGTAEIRVLDANGSLIDANMIIYNVVYIHPEKKTVVLADRISFQASGGTPPYTYTVTTGKGSVDPTNGLYTAQDSPGDEVIRATDATGAYGEAHITVSDQGIVAQQITTGNGHTCVLINGGVKCWGDNRFGQLGNRTLASSTEPVDVDGLQKGVSAISAGSNHTCAIVAGGGIKCWGDNRYGQLGNNSLVTSGFPVSVYGVIKGTQSISAGENHTCSVINGAVLCWGANRRGQLGNGSLLQSVIPVQARGLVSRVQAVSAGAAHTCALLDGGVYCWGYNYAGQLGQGDFTDRLLPMQVKGLASGVEEISVGGFHSCVHMLPEQGGAVKCWGYNGGGQLGNGGSWNAHLPVDVKNLGGEIASISSGYYHSCALMKGEGLKCWGYNQYGQIGDDSTRTRRVPVSVHALPTGVKAISAGVNHTCALYSEGSRCWGDNSHGQFGGHSTADSHFPAPLVTLH